MQHSSEIDQAYAASKPPPSPAASATAATATFAILFAMNLLDYVDRNILTALRDQIRATTHLANGQPISNEDWGFLATIFLVSYSVFSPIMGWLGDRYRRTYLLAAGVGVWSLATLGSGLARDYNHLALARSVLGIGEATYGVIAPTILLDLFRRDTRSRLMSAYYLAMPLGAALGIVLGPLLANTLGGWHHAFFVVGAPGIVAAIVALFLPEPTRGASEEIDETRLHQHETSRATRADYIDLMVNSSYTYSVFGMAAYTFAIGGMLVWIPTYLFSTRQIPQQEASNYLGGVTFLSAIIGMTAGGWLADRLAKTRPGALFVVPGVAMILSIPFVVIALLAKEPMVIYGSILLAETLMFVNTGPCSAIIANVVQPNLRAAAFAISTFAVHFLGDIWSPWLIGWAADKFGDADMMKTSIGQFLHRIGADPTQVAGQRPENIVAGLLILVPALLLSGIVLLAGARHLPREMALMRAKLKAAPAGSTPTTAPARVSSR